MTRVQTCALPIYASVPSPRRSSEEPFVRAADSAAMPHYASVVRRPKPCVEQKQSASAVVTGVNPAESTLENADDADVDPDSVPAEFFFRPAAPASTKGPNTPEKSVTDVPKGPAAVLPSKTDEDGYSEFVRCGLCVSCGLFCVRVAACSSAVYVVV